MKLKQNLTFRETCGLHVLMLSQGRNMTMLQFNDAAYFLWQKFVDADSFEVSDLAQALVDEYEIDHALATTDAQSILEKWQSCSLVLDE